MPTHQLSPITADPLVYTGLFNIRGSDIDYNPVVTSYALVTGSTNHSMAQIRLF